MIRTALLTLLAIGLTCPSALAQPNARLARDGRVGGSTAGEAIEERDLPSRFSWAKDRHVDRLRRVGDDEDLGHLERGSYLPLASWESSASLYERALEGLAGSASLSALRGSASGTAGTGTFLWRAPDGSLRTLRGGMGRVSLRGDLIRLQGRTAPLVIPSALGHFEASLSGEVAATVRAEALGVASRGPEGLDLTGLAIAGAFAEAAVEMPLRTDLAGVTTRIDAQLSGYAGLGAKAVFRVRLDPASGRFLVEAHAGLAVGVGGAAGARVELDASEVLEWLGLKPRGSPAEPRAGIAGAVDRQPG